MSYYAPSVPGSVVSQPTSQALVLANPSVRAVQYQTSAAIPITTGHSRYMYGSYQAQHAQYGYPQSVPVYVQPQQQQQVVYTVPTSGYNMPTTYTVPTYGYNGVPVTTAQYVPGMGTSVIIPGYGRRSRRRRHSHSGYPTYGY